MTYKQIRQTRGHCHHIGFAEPTSSSGEALVRRASNSRPTWCRRTILSRSRWFLLAWLESSFPKLVCYFSPFSERCEKLFQENLWKQPPLRSKIFLALSFIISLLLKIQKHQKIWVLKKKNFNRHHSVAYELLKMQAKLPCLWE